MGELIELDRKDANLTVEEVVAITQRADFDDIVVVGVKKGEGISVFCSGTGTERALWLVSKAQLAILDES